MAMEKANGKKNPVLKQDFFLYIHNTDCMFIR